MHLINDSLNKLDILMANHIIKHLPEAYFGVNKYGFTELYNTIKVIKNKAPFRYYGNKIQNFTDRYEQFCRSYYGMKYAHCVNSGTGALICALNAFGIKKGDEVIVPTFLWISITNAVKLCGAKVVFVDIDDSFNMDTTMILQHISEKTKCIIVPHMEGCQANIIEITKICKKRDIKILEDFSQCNGGTLQGKKIGSFGDISICSLQMNKIVSCGEGGLILTNNKKYHEYMVARSDFGSFDRKNQSLSNIITVGEGRRMSELQSAIMLAQMKRIDEMIEKMRNNKKYIVNKIKAEKIQTRNVLDMDGDTGYSIILIFNNIKQKKTFYELLKKNSSKITAFEIDNMGFHLYYNCMDTKKNFKKTNELFSRAVSIRLPANLKKYQLISIAIVIENALKKV